MTVSGVVARFRFVPLLNARCINKDIVNHRAEFLDRRKTPGFELSFE